MVSQAARPHLLHQPGQRADDSTAISIASPGDVLAVKSYGNLQRAVVGKLLRD